MNFEKLNRILPTTTKGTIIFGQVYFIIFFVIMNFTCSFLYLANSQGNLFLAYSYAVFSGFLGCCSIALIDFIFGPEFSFKKFKKMGVNVCRVSLLWMVCAFSNKNFLGLPFNPKISVASFSIMALCGLLMYFSCTHLERRNIYKI